MKDITTTEKEKTFFQIKTSKFSLGTFLLGIVAVCSQSVFPSVFIYCQNIGEAGFYEVKPLLLWSACIAISLYIVLALITRQADVSAIAVSIWMLVSQNYIYLQKLIGLIIPDAKYWHIAVGCVILAGFLVYGLRNVSAKVKDFLPDAVLCIAIVGLSLNAVNIIPALPKLLSKHEIVQQTRNDAIQETEGSMPNIYWIILDECGSFETMRSYYDMDTSMYEDALKEMGFSISQTSYNDAAYTDTVLTNCICLEYVVTSEMPFPDMKPYRQNGELYARLRENGYTLDGIGETDWLCVDSVTMQGSTGAKTISGKGVDDLIIQNTILYPFFSQQSTAEETVILDVFDYMCNSDNFAANQSKFWLTYLCAPHAPFLFDRNGERLSVANYDNWADKRYYAGYYQYTMSNTIECIQTIIRNDPTAVILLGSDHGPRQVPGMTDMHEKQRVLLAVYDGNYGSEQYMGKSTLNVLRLILNNYLGTNYEEIEVPYYE